MISGAYTQKVSALRYASIVERGLSIGDVFRVYYNPDEQQVGRAWSSDEYNYDAHVIGIDFLGEDAGIYCKLSRDDGEYEAFI